MNPPAPRQHTHKSLSNCNLVGTLFAPLISNFFLNTPEKKYNTTEAEKPETNVQMCVENAKDRP